MASTIADAAPSADTLADAQTADAIVARIERMPLTRLHLRISLLLSLGNFFDSFDLLILASALTVIVTSLHLKFVDVGYLLSSSFVGMTLGALLFGWLSEILGRRPMIICTVGMFGAFSAAAAFAWNLESLIAIRIVEGLALGGMQPIVSAMFNEFLTAKTRGIVNMMGSGVFFALGVFLAPLAGMVCFALFDPATGWRVLFLLGGLALPLAIAMYYLLPESPRWLTDKGRITEAEAVVEKLESSARQRGLTLPPPSIRLRADQQKTKFGELFQSGYAARTLLVWGLFFTCYFVYYGLGVWLPTLYVKIGGLPPSSALGLTVLFGAINVVKTIVFAFIVDWLGRVRGLILGFALCILGVAYGVVAVAWLHQTSWQVLLTVSVITGLGINFNAGLLYLYSSELFPTRMRSWATSTGSAANRIGAFIAPTAIGALLSTGFGIAGVFVMLERFII